MSEPIGDHQDSLFIRIGGQQAISALVEKLYVQILDDDLLSIFFHGTDVNSIKQSQLAFITMALGGLNAYKGEPLRTIHQPLVDEKGLSDLHFDRLMVLFESSLRELEVPHPLIQETLALVETTREDVLCK